VTVILIKVILIAAVVPILIAFYLGSAERLKTQVWHRRWIWNWAFFLLVVATGGLSTLEVWSYERSTPSAETGRPLHFMSIDAYQRELDTIQQKPSDWSQRQQELVRKFQFAQYAYEQRDYAKAIDALTELEKGGDALGSLFHWSSYVVANDLGCSYFKRQRNRGFLASKYLILAQSRVAPNSIEARTLEENLSSLDELVNRLD
jgi:hypothetical protein